MADGGAGNAQLRRREKYRGQTLFEFVAFCFFHAAVFENGAVLAGRYDYGRSLLMVGAVPFSVPALEFMVVVYSLWLLERMRLPTWTRPFLVGFFGMLQDFTLILGGWTAFVLAPVFGQGSCAEWAMLAAHFAFPLLLLALVGRGRMQGPLVLRKTGR